MFGCTSETVEDGLEALEAVQERAFDLILMDIKMPRMDGVQATCAIRALTGPACDIPIVALTANADPDDARTYLSIGMCDGDQRRTDHGSGRRGRCRGRRPLGGLTPGPQPAPGRQPARRQRARHLFRNRAIAARLRKTPMTDPFLTDLLPQLAGGAAHTHALGFTFEGLDGDRVRIRVPYRPDLVGDPQTGVLAGGLVTTLLDHVGGLAVWVKLGGFKPIATLDLRVDYMRAAEANRDLIAEARCFQMTRSIAFVRAWAFEDSPDNPVAASQAAYVVESTGGRPVGANLRHKGGDA